MLQTKGSNQGGKKVGTGYCKCWNSGLHSHGAECRKNELAHFYDRDEQADAEAVGVSVSKPSAAKTCSHVFIAEAREHALEQSESAVGVARSRVSQK